MAGDRGDEEQTRKSFKVVDNRRFDHEGAERSGVGVDSRSPVAIGPEGRSAKGSPGPVATPLASQGIRSVPVEVEIDPGSSAASIEEAESEFQESVDFESSGAYESGESDPDFSSFIVSLATQALMQLGLAQPGEEIAMPVDKLAAQQTIDIIAMLQAKTRGNLTPSEAQLVEQVVHELRLAYVKVQA